jgi:small subunit ribosomal protein S16
MVSIRLTQTGKRNAKTHRIIVIDSHKKRDGKAIEILGFYNPLVKPPQISIDKDRLTYWKSVGAQISPTVEKLLAK